MKTVQRNYEFVGVLPAILVESQVETILNNYAEIITSFGGSIVAKYNCGLRDLAYPIAKNTKGTYLQIDFVSDSNACVNELKRRLHNDKNNVIRSSIVHVKNHQLGNTWLIDENAHAVKEGVDIENSTEQTNKCYFDHLGAPIIDYKNVALLRRMVSRSGKILPKRMWRAGKISSKSQRKIRNAILVARSIALLAPVQDVEIALH